jgi:predicted DNA-binding protein with PD1-like motif
MTVTEKHPVTRRRFLAATGLSVAAAGLATAAGAAAGTAPRTKATVLNDHGGMSYLLVFDKGEEVMEGLRAFARHYGLSAGYVVGIGAFRRAVLGYFDPHKKDYLRIEQPEQAEVLSLIGNLAFKNHDPFWHVHVTLGLPDGSARGGHLLEATVWPTLELVVTESPRHVERRFDPETHLFLLDPWQAADR